MVEVRSRRPARPAERPAPVGDQVLIIDDEELIRDSLAEYLTQEGFPTTTCASGEEALELAARRPFAIVLCDVQLPGMDGLQTLERLQQLCPETCVLLITAYATVESAVVVGERKCHFARLTAG